MLRLTGEKLISAARKLHWKELLGVLFVLLAVYFFNHQGEELNSIIPALKSSHAGWVSTGVVITVIYILLQAALYIFSFLSVHGKISWIHATELFLKRNLLSVFLPAGGISSLAYMPKNIRDTQLHKHQVHQASSIYGFIGIFSVFIVAIPLFIYLSVAHKAIPGTTGGLITLLVLLAATVFLFKALKAKGKVYHFITLNRPKVQHTIDEIFSFDVNPKQFINATIVSLLIEAVGIIHLYIAMLAVGVNPSLEAAIVGYIVATIFLIISPFLRGLGAVEVGLTFILKRYGFTTLQSLEITVLFRIFEFWLPLLAGVISFAAKGKQLLFRLAPPVLIFVLGLTNIFSVLTPPVFSRLTILRQYIPMASIQATNMLVVLVGLTMVVLANYLFKGLRNAWLIAIALSVISCLANIFKALDYEEAVFSLVVLIVLLATSRQYRLKSNKKLTNIGVITGLATAVVVLVFGTLGFYFLDRKHFGINFSWYQSFSYAFNTFILVEPVNLDALTKFGNDFLLFIRVLGIAAWAFFFYCIIRPAIHTDDTEEEDLDRAKYYLEQYGDSPLDYFKVASDKLLFVSDLYEGFIAYRIANGFAVVLEEPVCAEENKTALLIEFENYCKNKGLKTAFYRVDEESLYHFNTTSHKRKIIIGQEAVMDVRNFTLEGKDKKSLRNGLNSLAKKGYIIKRFTAPLPGYLVQALEQVSNEWLKDYEMDEVIFSQGMFRKDEIKQQDVIIVSDTEEHIVGFLNIIPDYADKECTYDMIRKTANAPGGCMDALIIELINYTKEKDCHYLNFGLVPMSGIEKPASPAEGVVKFAYEKVKRFSQYKGLRDFKDKYATQWVNKYLVYENDFDLMLLPSALNKVMQP